MAEMTAAPPGLLPCFGTSVPHQFASLSFDVMFSASPSAKLGEWWGTWNLVGSESSSAISARLPWTMTPTSVKWDDANHTVIMRMKSDNALWVFLVRSLWALNKAAAHGMFRNTRSESKWDLNKCLLHLNPSSALTPSTKAPPAPGSWGPSDLRLLHPLLDPFSHLPVGFLPLGPGPATHIESRLSRHIKDLWGENQLFIKLAEFSEPG